MYSVHKAEQGEEGAQRDLALLREEGLSEVSQLHLHLHPHHSHTLVVCLGGESTVQGGAQSHSGSVLGGSPLQAASQSHSGSALGSESAGVGS